jgi:hypothetical protein
MPLAERVKAKPPDLAERLEHPVSLGCPANQGRKFIRCQGVDVELFDVARTYFRHRRLITRHHAVLEHGHRLP